MSQLPSSRGSLSPSHESLVEPFCPAWASWRQILARLLSWTKSTIRFQAPTCSALYMPAQPGLMRPSRETSVISV